MIEIITSVCKNVVYVFLILYYYNIFPCWEYIYTSDIYIYWIYIKNLKTFLSYVLVLRYECFRTFNVPNTRILEDIRIPSVRHWYFSFIVRRISSRFLWSSASRHVNAFDTYSFIMKSSSGSEEVLFVSFRLESRKWNFSRRVIPRWN